MAASPHASAPHEQLAVTRFNIVVNGQAREYLQYAPVNVAQLREYDARGVKVVISLHDDNQTAETNAQRTGWPAIAEREGLVVIFPAAAGNAWNTTHRTDRGNDVDLIGAAAAEVRARFGLPSNIATYLTGVGKGATMAHELAMRKPSAIAGLAGIAAINGIAERATLELPASSFPKSATAVWQLRSLPTPMSVDEQRQLAYWQAANETSRAGERERAAGRIQTIVYTKAGDPVYQVRVSSLNAAAGDSPDVSEKLWDELFRKMLRFPDNTKTNGSLHADGTIASMGLIETTQEVLPGVTRRWLTYVPSNYSDLVASGKKLPLVFSFHGRNGSARFQALITQWHALAEEKGFIVVYPHGVGATWVTSIASSNTDVQFFLALFDQMKSTFQIDTSRVFLNGSSQGTALTNRIAVQYPELFASIAPCYSGHLSPASYQNAIVKTNVPLPVWQCRGADEVPTDFPGGTAGETAARNFWRETVNKNFGPPTIQVDGRKTTEIWNDGLAEYRWQITADMPHFWHPGQARKMWDEMLSKYQRLPDGVLQRVD